MAVSKIKVNSLGTTGTASATTFLRGDMAWTANAGGDVVGPASATDDALAKYDGTTGKIVQNSNATLSDAGTLTATAFAGPINGNLTGAIQTAAQTNITSVGTLTSFASTGIDDNADAVAVTINSSEQVGIGTATPNKLLHLLGGDINWKERPDRKSLVLKILLLLHPTAILHIMIPLTPNTGL